MSIYRVRIFAGVNERAKSAKINIMGSMGYKHTVGGYCTLHAFLHIYVQYIQPALIYIDNNGLYVHVFIQLVY